MQFALLHRQMPERTLAGFHVDNDGVCSACRAWERELDVQLLDADLAMLLMARPPRAVVALSGGKDSLSTLVAARLEYGLDVVAVLFDNTFIPASVKAQAAAVCHGMGVDLVVETAPPAAAENFARSVETMGPGAELPCFACSHFLLDVMERTARARGAKYVLLGTNYHASWGSRPRAAGLMKDGQTRRLHLPFAARHTPSDVERNLARVGAVPGDMRGHSTNCAVPGLVQVRLAPSLGHAPEREDLALEVMSGHLTRGEALATLARKGG